MTIQEILEAHKPSRWRSFTNENEILRCCGKDFGNATKKAKRGDAHLAWTEFSAHVAQVLEQHEREAKAEALEEAAANLARESDQFATTAERLTGHDNTRYHAYSAARQSIAHQLRDRAAQLKESP